MKRLRTAVIGTGFMGRVHLEALRRVENVDVVAIAGRNHAAAKRIADSYAVQQTEHWEDLLADSSLDAVHICTPNAQHFPIAQAALAAGKHVLCEKPLAISAAEAASLLHLAQQQRVRHCLCHNLRYYPMVQQMRQMREAGELGEILIVQGTYSQDWLLFETDWNWRLDSAANGPSRAMADIGTHWFDMAEHLSGLRVQSLCADWSRFLPTRKRPTGSIETFAGKRAEAVDAEEVTIDTEDFGAVLFRLGDRARGTMTASQVSAGRKNALRIELYGSKSGVAWDQERPNELWIGQRNSPNQLIVKDPSLLLPGAASYADLPGGHSEGYADTFKQIFRRFYASIRDPERPAEYPQFSDGLRQMQILEAQMTSNNTRSWQDVPAVPG